MPDARAEKANDVVRRNTLWAMGLGAVPVPVVDLVAVTGVQVKMIHELAELYAIPFSTQRAKSIVSALVGGLGSVAGAHLLFSMVKFVPFVGQTAGAVSMPISGGATTWAIGKVFSRHFAAGGTLIDFDVPKAKEYFRQEYESAKATVKDFVPAKKN